ncbi:hypothetical protein SBFV3_gp34 [Sulfolobales Beppu filamentous virus 3]|uniref:Uncharacterized protein n=1 Tax=Sulfolobales Beppu filamentous virus 3 TaxID=2493124 RepID=A0A3S8NEZ2_9VIRU|nr:hypothetical protein HOU83_gp34 [Sulfolobales Beppu filamentous virus 3]AZI75869.1 hypothetical protein SBFV3_gp34 [Sulfolobales Beppu filamentous virus 3]
MYITDTSLIKASSISTNSTSQHSVIQQQGSSVKSSLVSTGIIPSLPSVLSPIFEYMCAEIQIRFYYKHGDYVGIEELLRILAKCSSTPDVLFRKLLENGIIKPGNKPDIVQVV